MKTSTKRALSLIFSLVFIIFAIIIFTNLIQPEIKVINELRGKVAATNNLYLTQKNAIEQVSKVISQFNNATDLQKSLSLSMPIGANITEILNQYETISKNNMILLQGLDLKITPPVVSKKQNQLLKGMGIVNINMSTIGSYNALKQFLSALETNIRITKVNTLNFQKIGGGSDNNTLFSMSLEVETYYQSK